MAQDTGTTENPPKKRAGRALIPGLILAVLFAGGGFYATWSGILNTGGTAEHGAENTQPGPLPDIAFVAVEPIIVSLGRSSPNQHLRFTSQLEVNEASTAEVTLLLPRILDVLNGYLRAVEVSQLEDPSALVRIRAQMLRRIQIVTGEGRVRDLLITEFVLN